jgi:hypothetical protein
VRQAVQTRLEEQAPTLASFLELLGPGSACFCCGHPLRVSRVANGSGSRNSPTLTCLRCGAGVFEGDAPEVETLVTERHLTSLVAA